MTTDYQPTDADLQAARDIVKRCGLRDGLFKGPRTLNAVETIAYALLDARRTALSSRDQEIREVLEGLSSLLHIPNGEPQRCWCTGDRNYQFTHSPACLAARGLYEKLNSTTGK